jgi:hypothetical protein
VSLTLFSDFYPNGDGVPGTTIPTPTPSLLLPASKTFSADLDGTIITGQLPYVISAIRKSGTNDVSLYTTWSITANNCTATIDSATGDITITAVAATGSIAVESVYKGITLRGTIAIVKEIQTSTGGGSPTGDFVTTSLIPSTSSTSYSGYTPTVLTLQAGSAGQIKLTADISFDIATDSVGSYNLYSKGQYRAVGSGTWIDIASEAIASPCTVTNGYS